jgi:hypothetical protein
MRVEQRANRRDLVGEQPSNARDAVGVMRDARAGLVAEEDRALERRERFLAERAVVEDLRRPEQGARGRGVTGAMYRIRSASLPR